MKLHSSNYDVEKSSDFEENQFTIEASAKAFMILSDGLYSNKILAVVRELSTNAYDSHVDAGCVDKPFEVHLPTRLEPYFHVRDFGTSMTHDQCMKLYTTYFRSTRNDSNDSVGCLGLGSKAPFAYADNFTVEAFLNGEKRIYSAHRGKNGNPTFALLETVATSEPNGIKVSISVRENDMNTFIREAANVYEYFKVRPTITGIKKLNYNQDDVLIQSDDKTWQFCDDHDSMIIMGQIAYQIDPHGLYEMFQADKNIARFIYNVSGLRIYVNIGDVDITPSRESISFTEQTKAYLKSCFTKIINDIKISIENSIKSQETLYLARKRYIDIESQCDSVRVAMESLKSALEWNGQKLFDTMLGHIINVPNAQITHIYKSGYRKKLDVDRDHKTIRMDREVKFYIDDLKRGGISRLRKYLNDQGNRANIYLYNLKPNETVESCELLQILGGATVNDVNLTSALPKIVREHSGASVHDISVVDYYDQYENKMKSDNFSVKTEDAVYIPTKKGECTINGFDVNMLDVITMLSYCYQYRHFDKKIFFLSPSMIYTRKLEKRDNWEGPEYVLNMVQDVLNAYADEINDLIHEPQICFESFHKAILMTKTDNVAKQIVSSYKTHKQKIEINRKRNSFVINFCRKIRAASNVVTKSDFDTCAEFFNPLKNEMKKYPIMNNNMLTHIYQDAQHRAIADYIDMIENAQVLTSV